MLNLSRVSLLFFLIVAVISAQTTTPAATEAPMTTGWSAEALITKDTIFVPHHYPTNKTPTKSPEKTCSDTLECFIKVFLDQIYFNDGNILKINLSPYFTYVSDLNLEDITKTSPGPSGHQDLYSVMTERNQPEGAVFGNGTWGNGNGIVTYSMYKTFGVYYDENGQNVNDIYKVDLEGAGESFYLCTIGLVPCLDTVVKSTWSLTLNPSQIEFTNAGKVDGEFYNQTFFAELVSISYDGWDTLRGGHTDGRSTVYQFGHESMISENIDDVWKELMMPVGKSVVNVVNNEANINWINWGMEFGIVQALTITGFNNDDDLGETVVDLTIQIDSTSIGVYHDRVHMKHYEHKEIFKLTLVGTETLELLSVEYHGPSYFDGRIGTEVVFQVIGPDGMEAFDAAIDDFIEPFENYFGHLNSFDDLIHSFVYFDKVLKKIKGKGYFNVYPILEATKFESPLLSTLWERGFGDDEYEMDWRGGDNEASVQDMFKSASQGINSFIYSQLEEMFFNVHFYIARKYVNNVTGAAGEVMFDAWFVRIGDPVPVTETERPATQTATTPYNTATEEATTTAEATTLE